MPAPDDTDYQEVARSLPPAAVSQYLAATGEWVLETRQAGLREIWSLPASSASPERGEASRRPRGRIMLPLATDFVDFGQHFQVALSSLAVINDWTPPQLEHEILSLHADTFLVRLDQRRGDASLPLRQAETTIEAMHKMLRAAAMTTSVPRQRFRGGRLPAPVSAFLDNDVRLGHTQRGSFIFTVVTQLGDSAGPASDDAMTHASRQAQQFPRRVMETLALGIETARDLAQRRAAVDLTNPARQGLSAGLVESLINLTEPDGLRSVDLSFDWAAAATRPVVGRQPVRLNHDLLHELQRIYEQLLQAEEPVRHETLIGTVVSLSRAEDSLSYAEAAAAIISADVDGRRRNVHLTLTGRQHDLAIQAYRLKLPIVVTGDLTFVRRTWRLEGNVEIDEVILLRSIADARRNDD
jgi:hypothetical protein